MADQNNLFPEQQLKQNNSKYSPPKELEITNDQVMGSFDLRQESSANIVQNSSPAELLQIPATTQQPAVIYPTQYTNQNIPQNSQLPPIPTNNVNFDTSFSVYNQDNNPSIETQANPNQKRPNPLLPVITQFKIIFTKYKIPILVSIGLVVALLVVLVGVSQLSKTSTKPIVGPLNNIEASIEGPKSLPQGTPSKWEVKVINNENVALEDLTIDLEFDKDFQVTQFLNYQPINVGKNQFKINLLDGVSGQNNILISFEGFLNAQVDLDTIMQGKLSYTPKLLSGQPNSQRSMQIAGLRTKVISPEVKLTIDTANGSIQNGGEGIFIVKIKNTKEKDLQDLRLRMIYPSGNVFNYTSSQFVASNTAQNKTSPDNGDDTWYIPRLAGLTEQTLTLKGNVKVRSAQKVPFGTELSMKATNGYKDLTKAYRDLNVTSEPVAITTTLDKTGSSTFSPGETLKFAIDYVNQGQDLLKNVEILGFVDDVSNLLDYDTISFVGGSRAFTNNNQIQWIGNNTPQLVSLAPQARGRLNYTIKVKQKVLNSSKNQSEYVLRPQVKIKATNLQEISSAGQLYKMKSNLRFAQTSKADEILQKDKTKSNLKRYLVTWQVKSEQNEIDNLQVTGFTRLPPSAWQPESVRTEGTTDSNIEYNSNTGQITWKVPKIPAYTGNDDNTPTIKISFELEVETKNNQNIVLIEAPTVTARDNFTGDVFNIKGKPTETKK
jgi:hypothetical protein